MSFGKQVLAATRMLPAAVALAILPALLVGLGAGCGNGLYSQATSSGSATPTNTPGTGAFLYASNFNDGKIVEFKRNLTTGALTTIATTTAGNKGVAGLAITLDNRFLYAADSGGNNVYQFRINPNGSLSRIGGGSISAGNGPVMIAADSTSSWLYVVNQNAGGTLSEYAINSSNGALTSNGGTSSFSGVPLGIVAHPSAGFIYVSDNQNGIIYFYTIQSDGTLKKINTYNSLGSSPGNPGLMTITSDSSTGPFYLYVPDTAIGVVSQFTIQSDGTLAFGAVYGTQSTTAKPIGIVPANNGAGSGNNYLFYAAQGGDYVQYFLRSTAILTPKGALAGLNAPTGILVDPNANFAYAGEFSSGTVAELSILGSCAQILCFVNRFATESGSGGGTQFLAMTN